MRRVIQPSIVIRLSIVAASVLLSVVLVGSALAKPRSSTDQAIAQAAFLQAKDFPAGAGWTAGDPSPAGTLTGTSCANIRKIRARYDKYRSASPRFTNGNAYAEDTVYVFPNVREAKRYAAAFKSGVAKDCIRENFEQQVPSNVTIRLTDIDTSGVGDDGVGFAVLLTAPTAQGGTEAQAVDLVGSRVGRVFVGFTFQSVDEPLDIQQQLVQSSIDRLTRALGR